MALSRMNPKNMRYAARLIKNGGVIAYPTDTVYGLGCDPFNVRALQRLITIKGRRRKPFPILVSSLEIVERIVHLNSKAKALAEKFWPGALTLILSRKASVPDLVTFGEEGLAIRIPGHARARELIELCGGFLIGTSANKTGRPPCFSAPEVEDELGDAVEVILDDGESYLKKQSTIIDLKDSSLKIVRKGSISESIIMDFLRGFRN